MSLAKIYSGHRPFLTWGKPSLSDKAVGGVSLAISIIAGSTFGAFGKALTGAFSSLSLLFVSEVLTAFFVLFTFGVVPLFRNYAKLSRHDVLWMLIVGFFNGVVGPFLLFAGLALTTAVNAGFISNMQMVFMVILAAVILKEKVGRVHVTAIATIFIGMLVISLKGFSDGLSLQQGDLLVIGSTLAFAIGSVYYRKELAHIPPQIALFARSMVAVVAFLVITPFIAHPFAEEIGMFPLALIPALIGFGFISRFLSSVSYYEALDKISITTVSLLGSLTIIGNAVFSYFYLGEPIEWYHYAGGAFIILGSLLLELVGTHPNEDQLALHLKQRLP